MDEYGRFYDVYGIEYSNPVYDKDVRTDKALFKLGVYSTENVKFTEENDKIEPLCNFKSIYHTVLNGYYFNLYGPDKFERITIKYYREKFRIIKRLIDEYLRNRKSSKLYRLLRNDIRDNQF